MDRPEGDLISIVTHMINLRHLTVKVTFDFDKIVLLYGWIYSSH